jgi:DNA-directed RNA polymerase subunit B"
VKNFAQGVELSTGVEEYEDVKNILLDLGVVPIGGYSE